MTKVLKIAIALVLIFNASYAQETQFIDNVEAYLSELSKDENFGLSISISKDGVSLLEKAYGYASREHKVANRSETRFNIASIGKLFTAVSVLQLREQDKIDLNERVGYYLPQFPNEFIRDSITIHQLLTHTSGLPLWFNEKFDANPKFEYLELNDYLKLFDQLKIDPSKTGKNSYSNVGYITLGFIIEKVSQMSYRQYVNTHIFEPLEMEETDIWKLTEIIPNVATGYIRPSSKEDWCKTNYHLNKGGSPAGGAHASSRDLLKFYNGLISNRLLSEESWKLMSSPKIKTLFGEYGYGIAINKKNNKTFIGHLGGYYGIRGELMWYKESNYIISILSNSDQTDHIDISYFIKVQLTGNEKEIKSYERTLDLIKTIDLNKTELTKEVEASIAEEDFDENLIQIKGYYYFNNKAYKQAKKLFALNAKLFPNSKSAVNDLKRIKE